MRSSLCGYEVCPVFAEQTTVPLQLMSGDGRTLCVCVGVCVRFGFEEGGDREGCYALELLISYPSLQKQLLGSLIT